MKKTFLFLISLVIFALGKAQGTDPGVNGQLKRMVYKQWDDWQPTPDLHWYGLPKNYYGWFYWRVLNNGYYRGEDKRPMRPTGPFPQNIASLQMQLNDDNIIKDTSYSMMEQSIATYTNMTGGDLDVPYFLYFKDKFNSIFSEVSDAFDKVQKIDPNLYKTIMGMPHAQQYLEDMDIFQDRIKTIHSTFVDRGVRIESYMQILQDLQPKVREIRNYLNAYIFLHDLPTTKEINAASPLNIQTKTDAQIVKEILKNHTF